MRAHLDDIDFDAVAAYERRFRHDVMAHVHAFGDVAPAAVPFIHLGATSAYVTDNADLILMRRGLGAAARRRSRRASARSRRSRASGATEPTLGYTHLQPAQLTTVGKRATLWMQDLVLDLADLDHRIATLPFRGVKGTTGTQASFLELFDGDHAKVRELDARVTAEDGFRSVDSRVRPDVHAQARRAGARRRRRHRRRARRNSAATCACFSRSARSKSRSRPSRSDRRRWRTSEIRCARERIASLARFVVSLEPNANQTHGVQFFERTLDDSANRRLVIPETFLATDAILMLMENVVDADSKFIRRAFVGVSSDELAVHGDRGADRARGARGRRPTSRARAHPAAQHRRGSRA